MSEPMDLTSPTHGHIYAHSLQLPTALEPGVPLQPSYPAIPSHPTGLLPPSYLVTAPHASTSVPPYLHSANRRFQPFQSPPIVSPPVSLPNAYSLVADNAFRLDQPPFIVPQIRSPTASLRQPASHISPVLSYMSRHSIIPSPIAVPVARAPIPDLNHLINNHSRNPSLRPNSIASHYHAVHPLSSQYAPLYPPINVPNAGDFLLRAPSRAPSYMHRYHLRTPSSVTLTHSPQHASDFHQTPPHIVNHIPQSPPAPLLHIPPQAVNNFLPNPPLSIQEPRLPPSQKPPTLPSTKDIPKLTGKSDWGKWNTAVVTFITNQQVFGHISDGLALGARYDPTFIPSFPPTVYPQSLQADVAEFTHWWSMDGIASHILCSTIESSILNSLPIPNSRLGERRTARDIYTFLQHHYGSGNYNSVANVETKLRAIACGTGTDLITVQEYITTYRLYANEMSSAGYPMLPRQLLQLFADGLPNNALYTNLRQMIYFSLDEPDDVRLISMEEVYGRAKVIDDTSRRMHLGCCTDNKTRQPIPSNPSSMLRFCYLIIIRTIFHFNATLRASSIIFLCHCA